MSKKEWTAMAIGCHPDDIEFMMSGTLFLLREQGVRLHYMNLANGSCGTQEYGTEEIIQIRGQEAQTAAAFLGAEYYPPIAPDLEVVYDIDLVRRTAAAIRKANPDILLIPSLYDYMEDHMFTARIAITAAFSKGMPNFTTIPETPIAGGEIALYHALPYGLKDAYRKPVEPDFITDISGVIQEKATMLSMHQSQRNWLDESQKLDSYVETMRTMSAEVGRKTGRAAFGEGWIRHNPLGYSDPSFTPLENILDEVIHKP